MQGSPKVRINYNMIKIIGQKDNKEQGNWKDSRKNKLFQSSNWSTSVTSCNCLFWETHSHDLFLLCIRNFWVYQRSCWFLVKFWITVSAFFWCSKSSLSRSSLRAEGRMINIRGLDWPFLSAFFIFCFPLNVFFLSSFKWSFIALCCIIVQIHKKWFFSHLVKIVFPSLLAFETLHDFTKYLKLFAWF